MTEHKPGLTDRAALERKMDSLRAEIRSLFPPDCPAWKINLLFVRLFGPEVVTYTTGVNKDQTTEVEAICISHDASNPICQKCPLGMTQGGITRNV